MLKRLSKRRINNAANVVRNRNFQKGYYMASLKFTLMNECTEKFVNLLCEYRKKGLSKVDVKFMLDLFISECLDEADIKEENTDSAAGTPVQQPQQAIQDVRLFSQTVPGKEGYCNFRNYLDYLERLAVR
jgi:hypothetical protein